MFCGFDCHRRQTNFAVQLTFRNDEKCIELRGVRSLVRCEHPCEILMVDYEDCRRTLNVHYPMPRSRLSPDTFVTGQQLIDAHVSYTSSHYPDRPSSRSFEVERGWMLEVMTSTILFGIECGISGTGHSSH